MPPTGPSTTTELPKAVQGWPELNATDAIGFRPAEACDIAAAWFPRVQTEPVRHRTTRPGWVRYQRETGETVWLDTTTGEIDPDGTGLDNSGQLDWDPTAGPKKFTSEVPSGIAPQSISFCISPGSVRVAVAKPSHAERVLARIDAQLAMETFLDEVGEQEHLPGLEPHHGQGVDDEQQMAGAVEALRKRTERLIERMGQERPWNVVTEFSRKSRQRLRQRAAEVDWYTPLQRPGCRIGMLTLTYPGSCWRDCAPDPTTIRGHLTALEKRLARALGYKVTFVWAREFMRSGAPHFHLAGVFPTRVNGERLKIWLLRNWAEIVDAEDKAHYRAGTRVDWSDGLDASDPNRLAAYFGAYATGKGSKEYQHHAPEEWANPNGSHGRHWGARNTTQVRAEFRLSRDQLVEVQRFLRRYLAAQKRTMRSKGPTGQRSRPVNRRWKLRSLVGVEAGFTFLTNDGPNLAVALARATTPHQEEPWPRGQPRPLP